MQKIRLTDTTTQKVYVRDVPENWADLKIGKRMEYARHFFTLPRIKAVMLIAKDALNLPKNVWYNLDPNLLASISQQIRIDTAPSATPIIDSFKVGFSRFHLPKADFDNGTIGEFIIALDHYEDYAQSRDKTDLYLLFATLARVSRRNAAEGVRFGDVREPIFDNSGQTEKNAKRLAKVPIEYALVTLRYFEGVKKMIFDEGIRLNLWQKPQNTEGSLSDENPVNLFGWRSVLRGLADGDVQKYDALFQRRFWEIFQILMERQAAADYIESMRPKNETD
jgi:hypothetical protein